MAVKFPDGKNFGMNLRAHRLGFLWSRTRGGYIRITEEAGEKFLVECAPPAGVPSRSKGATLHRVWNDNGEDILDEIECLKMVKKIRRHFWFYVDEKGKLVKT